MPSTTTNVTGREHVSHTLIARLIFGLVGLLYAAHLSLFALYAAPSGLEATLLSTEASSSPLFLVILAGLKAVFGSSSIAARMVSVICAVAILYLNNRAAQRWSEDQPAGAALTWGLILFPTTAYAFAQATPVALMAFLLVLTVILLVSTQTRAEKLKMAVVALLCGVMAFLHPVGTGIALVLIMLGFARWGFSSTTAPFVMAVIGVTVFLSLLLPLPVSLTQMEHTPPLGWGQMFVTQILQPYAMLWVAIVFSIAALLWSKPLRAILGPDGLRRSVVLLAVFSVSSLWIVFSTPWTNTELQVHYNAVVPLGVLAALPMVMWIRLVMPQLKSIVVWILLPVIMYSCFWVVLGPIDLNGFPYDQLARDNPFLSAQPPR